MPDNEWYYCVEHKTVERRGVCRAVNRLGPYQTRAEAEQAMERVAERNETWEQQDKEWEES